MSRGVMSGGVMGRAMPALVAAAAAALLLGGCRGGAAAAPAERPRDTPATVAGPATSQPDPQRLADVESALDRIERELDSDGSR